MYYFKIPQLNGKVAAISILMPDIDFNMRRTMLPPRPFLWTLLDQKPLKEGAYDLFRDTLGEKVEFNIDYEIKSFNDQLANHKIHTAKVVNTYTVNGTQFIVIRLTKTSNAILMLGRRPLDKENKIYSGKDGYFWHEVGDYRRLSKVDIREKFNLTKDEADEFMTKY